MKSLSAIPEPASELSSVEDPTVDQVLGDLPVCNCKKATNGAVTAKSVELIRVRDIVRGQEHIFHGEKGIVGKRRLRVEDVQSCPRYRAPSQCLDQRWLVNYRPARRIDEVGGRAHLGEGSRVDEMMCRSVEWRRHTHEVADRHHLLELREANAEVGGDAPVDVRVVCHDLDGEWRCETTELLSDISESDQTDCASGETGTNHLESLVPAPFAYQRIALEQAMGQRQYLRKHGARDRSPHPVGRDSDGDAGGSAGCNVDVVVADPEARNDTSSGTVGKGVGGDAGTEYEQAVVLLNVAGGESIDALVNHPPVDAGVIIEQLESEFGEPRFPVSTKYVVGDPDTKHICHEGQAIPKYVLLPTRSLGVHVTPRRSRVPGGRNQKIGYAMTAKEAKDDGTVPPGPNAMVQVLDRDGSLVGGASSPMSDEDSLDAFGWMLLSRLFDERAYTLQRQGRLGTFAAGSGQEAVAVGVSSLLRRDRDWIAPAYREVAALLHHGWNLRDAILYYRGHPHGWGADDAFCALPMQVALAAQLPHAVGLAWGMKLQSRDGIVVAFVGDGGSSEGDFHESLNFAGVFGVPLVFVIQNNQWAISTPFERQTHAASLADRGAGYGIPSERVDGNDLFAVREVAERGIERARTGGGPTLIEAVTYRLRPHNTADDSTRYVDPEEQTRAEQNDPLARLRTYLEATGALTEEGHLTLEEKLSAEIDAAVSDADAYPDPDPLELFDHVWSKLPPRLEQQRQALVDRIGKGDA
jgi:pyruvate dehydrogenase E1 component alpha subunit